jgi:hypothetical protein
MVRTLFAAALLIPFAAQAQSTPSSRPMPSYNDGQPLDPRGYYDSYGTADTHHHVDQTPPPPPGPEGYDGEDRGPNDDGWQTPPPHAQANQVDESRPDDAMHRADRARTSSLNRRRWPGRNVAPTASSSYAAAHAQYQAELADHAREMRDYRAEQSHYTERMARWQARTDACEHGDRAACDGPE